jgi:protein ImuB
MAGNDTTPLVPYVPPRRLQEESTWDEPVDGREPLLFVVRGLSARIAARLSGRGEAARTLVLSILSDLCVARFRGAAPVTRLEFSLPKALWKSEDIYRVIASKLERVELTAPSIGLRLEVDELTEASPRQLELGLWGSAAAANAIDELPIVIAELEADLGQNRVGLLEPVDSHRPELGSILTPALKTKSTKRKTSGVRSARRPAPARISGHASAHVHRCSRLLPQAVPFDAPLRAGATVMLERRLYTVESVRFEQRLEAVEWWAKPVYRDYIGVVLRGGNGVVEGLVYLDRETGNRYWQAVRD